MNDDEARARDEPFLQRWMRRKSAAREQPVEEDSAPPPAAVDDPESVTASEDDAPVLPDLETLDQESDYSAFLSPKVDEMLRRKALRQLFHSPKFNVCDGLDDYCGDFTQFEPLGDLVTAEMRHHLERAARAAQRLARPNDGDSAADQNVASSSPLPGSDDAGTPPNDDPDCDDEPSQPA